jgi:hypothetical protein
MPENLEQSILGLHPHQRDDLKLFIAQGTLPRLLTLRRLCTAGLVDLHPRHGYVVVEGVQEALRNLYGPHRRKGLAPIQTGQPA